MGNNEHDKRAQTRPQFLWWFKQFNKLFSSHIDPLTMSNHSQRYDYDVVKTGLNRNNILRKLEITRM